jgi:hypothetical protein
MAPHCRLTGDMLAAIPASPIAISCIIDIGIQQAERAVASEMNSVIANEIDMNLNRPVITICILLSYRESLL